MKSVISALLLAALAGAGPAAAQEPIGFKTPSGNIHCQLFEKTADQPVAELRCDIREMSSAAPPRPRDCEQDWGQAFAVRADTAPATRLCHGDTVADSALPALAYGAAWQCGGFACRSETTGLTCVNAANNGFALAKASQRLF
ncbi:MAG: hypothetical protein Q8M26_17530 [Pseudolabrys sp.]|nr:hypothetical protein [Pseudolabrys sp.]